MLEFFLALESGQWDIELNAENKQKEEQNENKNKMERAYCREWTQTKAKN